MNYGVAVRGLHRVQHLEEQAHASGDIEVLRLCKEVVGHAIDALQGEPGTSVWCRACVVEWGDARMREPRQNLPLPMETFEQPGGFHARVHDFNGYPLLDLAIGTLRQIHGAHAATPQKPEGAIRAKTHFRRIQEQILRASNDGTGEVEFGAAVGGEQGLYFTADLLLPRYAV